MKDFLAFSRDVFFSSVVSPTGVKDRYSSTSWISLTKLLIVASVSFFSAFRVELPALRFVARPLEVLDLLLEMPGEEDDDDVPVPELAVLL